MLNERQTIIARFYARLASLPLLEGLSEAERLELIEELRQIWPIFFESFRVAGGGGELRSVDSYLPESGPPQELLEGALHTFHQHARDVVAALLDDKAVTLTITPRFKLTQEGELLEGWNLSEPTDPALMPLINLIKQWPFPFRKCPVCQKVFVPVRRQLYCSPTCTRIAVEENRREQRREYQREYQRKRRKYSKKQQAKQQKPRTKKG